MALLALVVQVVRAVASADVLGAHGLTCQPLVGIAALRVVEACRTRELAPDLAAATVRGHRSVRVRVAHAVGDDGVGTARARHDRGLRVVLGLLDVPRDRPLHGETVTLDAQVQVPVEIPLRANIGQRFLVPARASFQVVENRQVVVA